MQNETFGTVEKAIEDRVKHLEETLPNLVRLADHQGLAGKFEAAKGLIEELSTSSKEIKDKVVSLADHYQDSIKNFSKNHQDICSSVAEIKASSANMADKFHHFVKNAKEDIDALFSHHAKTNAKIDEVKDGVDSHPNFLKMDEMQSDLASDQVCTKIDVDNLKKLADQLRASQSSLIMNIDSLKRINDEQKSEIESLKKTVESLRFDIEKNKSDSQRIINKSVDELKDSINEKILKLPVPEKVPVDDIRNEFSKKIEPVAFDAKNANLRSSNNESKITILEKKVEQLFLLKNQAELNK